MSRYAWECRYEKGWGAWSDPDYERCGAYSKKAFKNEKLAIRAADTHERKTGHDVSVYQLSKGERY